MLFESYMASCKNSSALTFISMNSANEFLLVMSFNGPRTLFNRTNLSLIISTTSIETQCAIASQYENLFIAGNFFRIAKIYFLIFDIGCDRPTRVRTFNETTVL